MGGSIVMGVIAGWFLMENPIKMDDLEVYPHFRKPQMKNNCSFVRVLRRICFPVSDPSGGSAWGDPCCLRFVSRLAMVPSGRVEKHMAR